MPIMASGRWIVSPRPSRKIVVWLFSPPDRPAQTFATDILPGLCPYCYQPAVTALPPPLLAEQTDGTTHVCHPALGGCNQGFHKTQAREEVN